MTLRLIVTAFFLSFSVGSFAQESEAERTLGEIIDDATITTRIKSALIADAAIKALRIGVDTLEGKVTLTGSAETADQLARAAKIAEGVRGVRSVENRIVLSKEDSSGAVASETPAENRPAKPAGRTAGQVIDDAWINAQVKTALMQHRQTPGLHIDVDTTNGVVTLKGKLTDPEVAKKAVEVASQVEGVKAVNNEFQIAGEGASGRVGTAGKAPSPGDAKQSEGLGIRSKE